MLINSSPALIVVDMQKGFVYPGQAMQESTALDCIEPTQKLINTFRDKGFPVAFLKFIYSPRIPNSTGRFYPAQLDYSLGGKRCCFEGDLSCDIIDELQPLPGEIIIEKHGYSGFYNTSLDDYLRCNNIKTLVFTGVCTDICLFSTVDYAFHLDYECIVASDCTATSPAIRKQTVLEVMNDSYAKVFNSDEIVKMVNEYKNR